ncbi:hypothetical protein M3Y98_00924100 [Aphelenchoides besseyi]|nr:hypothetical protein M3Y98_00924100 [Aphelenchoides besseyi]
MPPFIPVHLVLELQRSAPFVDITMDNDEPEVSRQPSDSAPVIPPTVKSKRHLPRPSAAPATRISPPLSNASRPTQRQCFGNRTYSEVVVESFIKSQSEEPHSSRSNNRSLSVAPSTTSSQPSSSKMPDIAAVESDSLNFFSGNPLVEKTTGILHFYKNKTPVEIMSENCFTLCMMEVPAYVTCAEFIRFISPAADKILESKVIRDGSPNQYFVIIKFKTAGDCFKFYEEFNGVEFNSLDSARCVLLFVERLETTTEENGGSLPIEGLTELPTCAVCLERMDDGVLTILCNHSFHSECLQQCGQDITCPVCRFHQTPELIPDQTCSECGRTSDLWMCLICGNIGCGRYAEGHAYKHFEATSHTFTLRLGKNIVWDYVGDNFVHRLIQTSTDGKMVEFQGSEDDQKSDEKMNGIQLEYSCLLSSQLENQRLYFEEKIKELDSQFQTFKFNSDEKVGKLESEISTLRTECAELKSNLTAVGSEKAQLEKKVQKSQQIIKKLQSDLEEERQVSTLVRADKETLTAKNAELERLRVSEIKNLEDQVKDLMMHFEVQNKLSEQVSNSHITAEIMDALNDENPIPPLIDSLSLVNKRLKQVCDLVDVIHNGGRDHNPKTVIQRLPRHMRRRAMSHNIKRLPRRDRQFAVRVISKSNHKKKAPSRLRRRRPNNLRKEYARRESGEFRWLQTHVWHAKRFEMTNLWNFKIPLRCYQRGVRPLMRKLDDGVVMFDDSYCRLLRFRFFTSGQAEVFGRNYAGIKNNTFQSISEDRVSGSGIQVLFTIDHNEKENGQSEVILSVHPLFYDNPLRLIERLCACPIEEVTSKEEINVKLKERYNDQLPLKLFYAKDCQTKQICFLFFTFYGSKTIQKLGLSIKLLANDEIDYEDFQSIHKKWKEFCDSNGTSTTLPNGTSFTLLARDPRLYSSFSRLAISSLLTTTSLPPIENPDEWARTLQRSLLLFDPFKLNEFASASISEKRLNELKCQQLAPVKLRRYRVPILISMWNWCSTNKVTMLLPSNASRHFFLNFYRSGFRVGSISDRFLLCNEIADCMYPFHWFPLTLPSKSYRWKRYHKFSTVDLSAFGRWNQLTNWTHLVDNPKRLANFQLLLDRPDIEIDVSQFQNTKKVLIPVRIVVQGKGDITDNDLIYEVFDPPISTKHEEQDDSASKSKTFGLFQEYKTLEVVNVSKMFDRTTIPKRRHKAAEKTTSEEDLRHIIGRVVYSSTSLRRGRTEALGFVDLCCFPYLRSTRGKILLRKPNGQKFSSATVRMLFC